MAQLRLKGTKLEADARRGTISPGRAFCFFPKDELYWPKVMTPKVPLP